MATDVNTAAAKNNEPSLLDCFIPIIFLVLMLSVGVVYFGDNSSYGPNQIALLLSAGMAIIIGFKNGFQWQEMERAIINGISLSLGAVLILLAVGSLIGTWLLSGTVPTLIYYGLQILSPAWFYPTACIICGIIAMSIGSSWTTAATVGVAFIGIAQGLGLSLDITAGAIISGAYFGDKISPLSETTNLSPAIAGSELFAHIRYMLWTTIPSISITLIILTLLGINETSSNSVTAINTLIVQLEQHFTISLLNLLPLIVLISLAIKKCPAFLAVSIGAIIGGIWAVVFQSELIMILANDTGDPFSANLVVVWTAFFDGVAIKTGNLELDTLLSGGGMSSMLNTVWLIICALSFGAIIEHLGMLKKILNLILRSAKSTGDVIMSTVVTCIGTNVITADQYIAIVMPGRMYKDEYAKQGLDPLVLSRTLEDSGTITSPLIPWNTCGAYMYSVLMVNPFDYIFYCFFNLINPVLAVAYGYVGFKIKTISINTCKKTIRKTEQTPCV
jgi:NhaC family Na+:H+ antiporter